MQEWYPILATLINSAGVMTAVQVIKKYIPVIKERVPILLPIMAGALGPAVGALQGYLISVLGVPVDLSPITALVAGPIAVLAYDVGAKYQGR